MNMKCDCKDFYENMSRLDEATVMAAVHGYSLGNDFLQIRYCPWCGKPLADADKFEPFTEEQVETLLKVLEED